ncbi:glycosyltransferase [uncultured Rhodoblastus sp.]|uniref:glycosyltransferase n=1 Tax=uncultured Rhodoblastus sp. TaxID=543037 RepID=UPI0025E9D93A|nr:glycosyltransferase [uncultured Rhodoblastus sp.]
MVALRLHRSPEQKAAANWFGNRAMPVFTWAPAQPPAPFVRKADPILWHYVGDTRDWLRRHSHLTGVGRVSIEIVKAALAEAPLRTAACVYDRKRRVLTGLSHEAISELLSQGNYAGEQAPAPKMPRQGEAFDVRKPEPGDHVFFNGLVWTPMFEEIFGDLSRRGVAFSVLVHDIIPIERPDLVSADIAASFENWLVVAVNTANCIFVSTQHVKNEICRWALLAGVEIRGSIECIAFGQTALNRSPEAIPSGLEKNLDKLERGNFVLSVGTIDRRKNQALLCQIWVRLTAELGASAAPQLVLAGRDDIGVESLGADVAALVRSGKIHVADGLGDGEIASLYESCLFTLFPSLAEGYGLPVAESLSFGKLCIASDLAVIREHAGGFPWYFPAGDLDAAQALILRALLQPEQRQAAERAIAAGYAASGWGETFSELAGSARGVLAAPSRTVAHGRQRYDIDGTAAFATSAALALARKWCAEDDPLVSILIVNWNAAALTLECIRQVWSQTSAVPYEIIVVDNGSAELDVQHLRQLAKGVRLIELGCNRFFGEANNIAAEAASGKYLCLLNNDAFVMEGWLAPLVEKLEGDPEVAAAGPLFLYPDATVQEAGARIDGTGIPERFGRGEKTPTAETLEEKQVDYISAALLLVSRDNFVLSGGFDMKYEPAYYEDTDLCFKFRALGKKVIYEPRSRTVHVEGASANADAAAELRRRYLGDLNRNKFLSRWGNYLQNRDAAALAAALPQFLPGGDPRPFPGSAIGAGKPTAVLYTPVDLTSGGGERYLLSLGIALADRYNIKLATRYRYSRLRLQQLSCEFGVDLSPIILTDEAAMLAGEKPALFVAMGIHVIPPIEPIGEFNIYHCQFPFEMDPLPSDAEFASLERFQKVIVNSEFTRGHYRKSLPLKTGEDRPVVEIVSPPVPAFIGDATAKKGMILSVGRFFVGGHNKRQDAMIDAFKSLWRGPGDPLELHLAGAAMPSAKSMDHLFRLMEEAEGYPIHFHINASREKLAELYRDSAIYWHAAGYGTNLDAHPSRAEHFGISLVEAMSAQVVPIAFNAGGPAEIISHRENGFLYGDKQELIALSREALDPDAEPQRIRLARAAALRARDFSETVFQNRVREIAGSSR